MSDTQQTVVLNGKTYVITELPTTRWCPRCEQHLSLDEFYAKKKNADAKGGLCKTCIREYMRERYRKRREQGLPK